MEVIIAGCEITIFHGAMNRFVLVSDCLLGLVVYILFVLIVNSRKFITSGSIRDVNRLKQVAIKLQIKYVFADFEVIES